MRLDRVYVLFGLTFALLGMALGIHMSATHNHGQMVTHAHILLVGFMLSFVYAVIHRLWIPGPAKTLAMLQFAGHQIGAVMMITSLYLLFGGIVSTEKLEPVLAISSIVVLLSLVMMVVLILSAFRAAASVNTDSVSLV